MKILRNKRIIITGFIMSMILLVAGCGSDETEAVSSVASEITTESAPYSEMEESTSTDLALAEIVESDLGDNVYNDGTYTGVAEGFGEGLTVEVIIADNLIESIEVVAHNEHEEKFYGEPMATIPGLIIEAQDPIVDTVSGATFTSTGIINATIDALSQALVSGEVADALELPANSGHKH